MFPLGISAITTFVVVIISSMCLRCFILIQLIHKRRRQHALIDHLTYSKDDQQHSSRHKTGSIKSLKQIKTMIVLGSGGHTTEMLQLLEQLDPKLYSPVVYVVASSDDTSIARLKRYIVETTQVKTSTSTDLWKGRYPIENEAPCQNERCIGSNNNINLSIDSTMASVHRLPRPREVHQSYISSILPTLRSIYYTFQLLQKEQPDLILANGPGICVPLIYLMFLYRVLVISRFSSKTSQSTHCKLIFVESLCRVQTLSLSGKLVYPIVDQFVVHWPSLKAKYPLVNVCNVFVCEHD